MDGFGMIMMALLTMGPSAVTLAIFLTEIGRVVRADGRWPIALARIEGRRGGPELPRRRRQVLLQVRRPGGQTVEATLPALRGLDNHRDFPVGTIIPVCVDQTDPRRIRPLPGLRRREVPDVYRDLLRQAMIPHHRWGTFPAGPESTGSRRVPYPAAVAVGLAVVALSMLTGDPATVTFVTLFVFQILLILGVYRARHLDPTLEAYSRGLWSCSVRPGEEPSPIEEVFVHQGRDRFAAAPPESERDD